MDNSNNEASKAIYWVRPAIAQCDDHSTGEASSFAHHDINSGDVTVEDDTAGGAAAAGAVSPPGGGASRRASSGQANNIPYMQLFHHLKQKFPDLKDCDIIESIQKFGLDQSRCESELQQCTQSHISGYYGPWGRSGNWSSRSSPAATPTTTFTAPSTPVVSPHTSPFASQDKGYFHNTKSAPNLVLNLDASQVGGCNVAHNIGARVSLAAMDFPASSSFTVSSALCHSRETVSTATAGAGPQACPVPMNSQDTHAMLHMATTKHFIASTQTAVFPQSVSDMIFRQHSTSTETITEESSLGGSNHPSPVSTLPMSTPVHFRENSQTPNLSPEVGGHTQCSDIPYYIQPLIQPYPRATAYQPRYQEPYVCHASPQVYCGTPTVSSNLQNTLRTIKTMNELNSTPEYTNANFNRVLISPEKASVISENVNYPRAGISLRGSEFIPNINTSSVTNNSNSISSSRRSRSSTPGAPTTAPVLPSSYNPFGSYLHQQADVRRRRSENLHFEPVRVAPPPPIPSRPRDTTDNQGNVSNLSCRLTDFRIGSADPTALPATGPIYHTHSTSTAAVGAGKAATTSKPTAALLSEQRARQESLCTVLREGLREVEELQRDVEGLASALEAAKRHGEREAASSAQFIGELQEENRRLQSECDQMEGEILQTGEDPEVQDGEYGLPSREGCLLSPPSSPLPPARGQHTDYRLPPLSSPAESPRQLIPTRAAPPPPTLSSHSHYPPTVPGAPATPTHRTASAGEPLDAPRWSCTRCTYDNHPAMNTCEICGAIRMPPISAVTSSIPHTPGRAGGAGRRLLVDAMHGGGGGGVVGTHGGRVFGGPDSPRGGLGCGMSVEAVHVGDSMCHRSDTVLDGSSNGMLASDALVSDLINIEEKNISVAAVTLTSCSSAVCSTNGSSGTNHNTGNNHHSIGSVFSSNSGGSAVNSLCSHDDLETFRFVTGLPPSDSAMSSPRQQQPLGSAFRSSPEYLPAAQPDCYCHQPLQPNRPTRGHRRTGSGGSITYRLHRERQDICAEDVMMRRHSLGYHWRGAGDSVSDGSRAGEGVRSTLDCSVASGRSAAFLTQTNAVTSHVSGGGDKHSDEFAGRSDDEDGYDDCDGSRESSGGSRSFGYSDLLVGSPAYL